MIREEEMVMDKKMSVKNFIRMTKKTSKTHGVVVGDIAIEKELKRSRVKSRKIIKKELQDYFVLLDLGITALIEMHNVCKEKDFLYRCTSAKLVSQLLAMRELLSQGLMDSVKTINRAFHEMIEIFFACLIDKEFADEYGKIEELYDNNEFWKTKISGKKLDRYIHRIFDELDYPEEAKREYFKRRKSSNAFLSESVHASLNSAFSAYMMITLDGKFSTDIYGKITTAYPMAMYDLLTDICLINAVFFRAIDSEKAFAFKREDILGEKWIRYHYYVKLYDEAYDFYYQDLYKKGYDIVQQLHQLYEYTKQEEMKMGLSKEEIRDCMNKLK